MPLWHFGMLSIARSLECYHSQIVCRGPTIVAKVAGNIRASVLNEACDVRKGSSTGVLGLRVNEG